MNLLVNSLLGDFLIQLPLAVTVFFIFLISFAGIYLSSKYGILQAFLGFSAVSISFFAASFVLFLRNYLSDYFTPLLFGWMGFFGVSFYRYFFTLLENIQLRNKISLDPLTGLYNRRFMESRMNEELEKNRELAVLMVDIDNFKSINDTYGHQFGDDVIKNVSFAIKAEVSQGDMAVRYGGEEFCVILPGTPKEEAAQIGERIRKRIAACQFSYVDKVAYFTVSIGVASSKSDHLIASRALIRAADRALYHAKKTGKNRVSLYHND
jgi:diguanylate cyclase (GGDEF)-like protein